MMYDHTNITQIQMLGCYSYSPARMLVGATPSHHLSQQQPSSGIRTVTIIRMLTDVECAADVMWSCCDAVGVRNWFTVASTIVIIILKYVSHHIIIVT